MARSWSPRGGRCWCYRSGGSRCRRGYRRSLDMITGRTSLNCIWVFLDRLGGWLAGTRALTIRRTNAPNELAAQKACEQDQEQKRRRSFHTGFI